MVRRALTWLLVLAAVTLVNPTAAQAITDGEPDFEHTYVGAIVFVAPSVGIDEPLAWCSGTLVAPTVFVTAAHCLVEIPPEVTLLGVSFDQDLTDGVDRIVPYDSLVPHPLFPGLDVFDPTADLGVVVLANPVEHVGFAELPTLGQFNGLKPGPRSTFTKLGYGAQIFKANEVFYGDARYVATGHLVQRSTKIGSGVWLTSEARGTGGGTCYGDSGGAVLWQDTNILAAVHSFSNKEWCLGGLAGEVRLDTPLAQDFLSQFVQVPTS